MIMATVGLIFVLLASAWVWIEVVAIHRDMDTQMRVPRRAWRAMGVFQLSVGYSLVAMDSWSSAFGVILLGLFFVGGSFIEFPRLP